jgi:CubicO group peptidase (beta-lactamase class C family)
MGRHRQGSVAQINDASCATPIAHDATAYGRPDMARAERRCGALIAAVGLALCLAGCSSSARLNQESFRTGLGSDYRDILDPYRESIPAVMKAHKIPGFSIAVLDREGILWTAGFGRTGKRDRPVTPDTVFSIQSMSKTFTATAVMIAVQDGLVDLDAPITKYLPGFSVNSRFEEFPQDKMTLRHLLTHTAGFTHEAPVGNNADTRYRSFEEHIHSIRQTWLRNRVGEKHNYSNLGIDMAAYVLRYTSGHSFEQYMKQRVFDPLGMPNSSVDYDFVERHPNRARGHIPFVREVPLAIPMVAAGGVYTTARELSNFVRFHLNRGTLDEQVILEPHLIDAMYTTSPISKGYGLGIAVGEKHGTYYLNHGGGGFGFLTVMTWYPEYGIGCVALTNSVTHDSQHIKIADAILARLIEEEVVTKDTSGAIPPAAQLIGRDTKLTALPAADVVHTPTPYKPQWKRYARMYRMHTGGFKISPLASIALALGACPGDIKLTVEEKNGFLCIGDEKLEEHKPGLFFTPSGEVLDFRGAIPTWRNMKMDTPLLPWSL